MNKTQKRKQKKRKLKPTNTAPISINLRTPVWGTTNLSLFPKTDKRFGILLRHYLRHLPKCPERDVS